MENYTEQFIDEKRNKLKEFILLTNCQPNDLMVLKKCLADYHEDYNKSVHNVTDFCFGTQVMRLFYILNLPEEAINVKYQPVTIEINSESFINFKYNCYASMLFSFTRMRERNACLSRCRHTK